MGYWLIPLVRDTLGIPALFVLLNVLIDMDQLMHSRVLLLVGHFRIVKKILHIFWWFFLLEWIILSELLLLLDLVLLVGDLMLNLLLILIVLIKLCEFIFLLIITRPSFIELLFLCTLIRIFFLKFNVFVKLLMVNYLVLTQVYFFKWRKILFEVSLRLIAFSERMLILRLYDVWISFQVLFLVLILLIFKTGDIYLRLFLRGDIWLCFFLTLISFVNFNLLWFIKVILRLHQIGLSYMYLRNDLPFALISILDLHQILPGRSKHLSIFEVFQISRELVVVLSSHFDCGWIRWRTGSNNRLMLLHRMSIQWMIKLIFLNPLFVGASRKPESSWLAMRTFLLENLLQLWDLGCSDRSAHCSLFIFLFVDASLINLWLNPILERKWY